MLSKLSLMAMLVALPAASAEQAAGGSFCERLAPKLGMKPNMKRGGRIREGGWDVNIAKGLGLALFGGTVTAAFQVEAIEPTSAGDYDRLKDACGLNNADVVCKLTGPARLSIATKAGKVEADILAGERAEVAMRRTRISCHDE